MMSALCWNGNSKNRKKKESLCIRSDCSKKKDLSGREEERFSFIRFSGGKDKPNNCTGTVCQLLESVIAHRFWRLGIIFGRT